MSNIEKLELLELFSNMLDKDPKKRISSKDFDLLKIYKNSNLKNNCILEKPNELFYIPYISNDFKKGLRKIKNIFMKNFIDRTISQYFLTIHIFIRIMARTKPNINESDLLEIINESLNVGENYYNYKEGNYNILKKIEGVGYNPFFYEACYLDDLIILENYIFESDKIVSFYNTIIPSQLFSIFKQKYNYSKKSKNIELKQFFKTQMPNEKENYKKYALSPQDYHNPISHNNQELSKIKEIKEMEKKFREELSNIIEHKLKTAEIDNSENINVIYNLLKNKIDQNAMFNIKKILNKNISIILSKYLDYGYIYINGNNINYKDDGKEYIIVIDDNKTSLIHKNKNEATHYYSDKNLILSDYFQNYNNNFDYTLSDCCIIKEACIIFNIWYNKLNGTKDFNIKCLDKHTLFLILILALLT